MNGISSLIITNALLKLLNLYSGLFQLIEALERPICILFQNSEPKTSIKLLFFICNN